jgi:penicillin-binding protein 1A
MVRMMRWGDRLRHRDARRRWGYDLAGKTGTTSDYRDAWFIGYTGGFVTAVWPAATTTRR